MARALDKKNGWIGWVFFFDLWRGLRLTLRYMFSRTITHRYPDMEKWVPYSRHRGHHFIKTNDEGDVNCVGCELCSKICPSYCITVVPYEDEKGNRRPKVFDIDLSRCLFCGLCEDACPADAIKLGQEYEVAHRGLESHVVHLADLIAAPPKSENGGQVRPARLVDDGRPKTELIEGKAGYDWWQRVKRGS